MSLRRLAVRIVIGLKLATQAVGLRRRADIYVDCTSGWRYPTFLLRALRRCDDPVLEVPERDVLMAWGADGFRNFLLRTRIVREGARLTAPVIVASNPSAFSEDVRSRVRVSADWFSSEAREDGLVMPYFLHPDLHPYEPELAALASGERLFRIGFAGTMSDEAYREAFAFPMLGRAEVLGAILERFRAQATVVRTRDEFDELDPSASPVVFVTVTDTSDTTAKHVLRGRDYLAFLGRCAFVLTPPGYRMPLCHNLVEAMAVGAIPILNYADWVYPALEDGVNCLTFSTREELVRVIERALAMNDDEIAGLRRGVVAYYDEQLSVDSFARRLCPLLGHSPTIVVNSEGQTAALWRERQLGPPDRAAR